jgi:hypothetical protein
VKVSFVAGFGPIVKSPAESRGWWSDLGLAAQDLESKGHKLLRSTHAEEWGQTT